MKLNQEPDYQLGQCCEKLYTDKQPGPILRGTLQEQRENWEVPGVLAVL